MPKGILFLCVANSARSQMAEGIARSLAPPGVKIWSAGSRPTKVRPEAIEVLKEIGIDISEHRSKAVAEIPADDVDTVITLCAEEECPVFLGKAKGCIGDCRILPALTGSKLEDLAAFGQYAMNCSGVLPLSLVRARGVAIMRIKVLGNRVPEVQEALCRRKLKKPIAASAWRSSIRIVLIGKVEKIERKCIIQLSRRLGCGRPDG